MVLPIIAGGVGLGIKYGLPLVGGVLSYNDRRRKGQTKGQALAGASAETAAGALIFPGVAALGSTARGAYYAKNADAALKTARAFEASAKAAKSTKIAVQNRNWLPSAGSFIAQQGRTAALGTAGSLAGGNVYDSLTGLNTPPKQGYGFQMPPGYEGLGQPSVPAKTQGVSPNYLFAGAAGTALAVGGTVLALRGKTPLRTPAINLQVPKPSLSALSRSAKDVGARVAKPSVDVAIRGLEVAAQANKLKKSVSPRRGVPEPEAVRGQFGRLQRSAGRFKESLLGVGRAAVDPNYTPSPASPSFKATRPVSALNRQTFDPKGLGTSPLVPPTRMRPESISSVSIRQGPGPEKPIGYPGSVNRASARRINLEAMPPLRPGQQRGPDGKPIMAADIERPTVPTRTPFKDLKEFMARVEANKGQIRMGKTSTTVTPKPNSQLPTTVTVRPEPAASSPAPSKSRQPSSTRPAPSATVRRSLRGLAIEPSSAKNVGGSGIPEAALKVVSSAQARRAPAGPLTPVMGPRLPAPRDSSVRPVTIAQRVQDVLDRFSRRTTAQGLGNRPGIDPQVLADDTRRQLASGQRNRAISQMADQGIKPDATYVPGSTGQTWVGTKGPATPVSEAPTPSRLGPAVPPPLGPSPNFTPRGSKVVVPATDKRSVPGRSIQTSGSQGQELAEKIRAYQAQSASVSPRISVPAPASVPVPTSAPISGASVNPVSRYQRLLYRSSQGFFRDPLFGVNFSKGNGRVDRRPVPYVPGLITGRPKAKVPATKVSTVPRVPITPVTSNPPRTPIPANRALVTLTPQAVLPPPRVMTAPPSIATGSPSRSPSPATSTGPKTQAISQPLAPKIQSPVASSTAVNRSLSTTLTAAPQQPIQILSQRVPVREPGRSPSGRRLVRANAPGSGGPGIPPSSGSGSGGKPPTKLTGASGVVPPKPSGSWNIRVPSIRLPGRGRLAAIAAGGTALLAGGAALLAGRPQQGQQMSTQPGVGPFAGVMNDWFGSKGDNTENREAQLARQAIANKGGVDRANVMAQATRDAASTRLAATNPRAWQALYGQQTGQPREVYGPRKPGDPVQFVRSSPGLQNVEAVSTQNRILADRAAMERKERDAQIKLGIEQAKTRGVAYQADRGLQGIRYTQDQTTNRQRIITGGNIQIENSRGQTERYRADRVFQGVNAQANATVRRQQVESAGQVQVAGLQEGTKRYQSDNTLRGTIFTQGQTTARQRIITDGQSQVAGLQEGTKRYQSDNQLRGIQDQQRTVRYQSDNTLKGTVFEVQGRDRVASTEAGAKKYVADNELRGTIVKAKSNEQVAYQDMFGSVASAQASAAGQAQKAFIEADPELAAAYGEDEIKAIKKRRALQALYSIKG